MKKLITLILCIAFLGTVAKATNFYVDPTNGSDTGKDGLSWANAVQTLSQAVTLAKTAPYDVTVDNIFVKQGTMSFAVAKSYVTIDNIYGSCFGNESSPDQRPMTDVDGNGIIEPWEFQYPTNFVSTLTASSTTATVALTLTLTNSTFNGFTIVHNASSTSYLSKNIWCSTATTTFENNIIKNCNNTSAWTTASQYGLIIQVSAGTVKNCLFEKNQVTVTSTMNASALSPFMSLTAGSKLLNCVFRNNKVTIDYSAASSTNSSAGLKGMIVNLESGTANEKTTVTNSIIYNNESIYKPGTGTLATLANAATVCLAASGTPACTDSIINCTIANNKTTKMVTGGLGIQKASANGLINIAINNALWNNQNDNGTSPTVQNLWASAVLASGSISNNIFNAGATNISGTYVSSNLSDLDNTNTTGNAPQFKRISNVVGSGITTADSTTIKQADWRLLNTSYLASNGTSTSRTYDKAGNNYASGTSHSVGAYQYVTSQTITFNPFNPKTYGDATFTLAASGGVSGNPVIFTSSDPTVASCSGTNGATLTIVKVGTCNILANQTSSSPYDAASQVSRLLSVTTKNLTAISSPVTSNKVYDSTNAATITGTFTGIVGSDAVYLTGTFSDANVGTTKSVTATSTLGGAQATNYLYTGSLPIGLTANIFPVVSTFTGTGTNDNWSDAGHWTYAPLAATEVVVASGELTIDQTPIVVSKVTVNPGAKLTLSSGKTLTASSLTLQSDVSKVANNATFMDNGGTLTIPSNAIKVEQFITGARNWYVSSPVNGATTAAITSTNTLGAIPPTSVVSYDETKGSTTPWVTESSTLLAMKGYIAVNNATTPTTDCTITFTGALNTGSQSILLSRTDTQLKAGFNLVGNPYPSYLNWTQATAAAANVLTSIWYRTKDTGGYTFYTYNPVSNEAVPTTAGMTSYIPPMQAFWVRANDNTHSLTFDNTSRSHSVSTANLLKAPSANKSVQQALRLQVSNGTNTDETLVIFNPNASNAFDDYDSPKMSDSNPMIPLIYTTVGSENLVINGLNSIAGNQEIPLSFTQGSASSFTLKATEVRNFDADTRIILRDNLNGNEQELTNGATYSFSADNNPPEVGTPSTRFSVLFKSASGTTGLNPANQDFNVSIFRNTNNQITVNCKDITANSNVSVYNAVGQKLIEKQLKSSITIIDNQLDAGVYVVTVVSSGSSKTNKVILN